MSSAPSRPF